VKKVKEKKNKALLWKKDLCTRWLECKPGTTEFAVLPSLNFLFISVSLLMPFAFCHVCITTHSMDFLCFPLSLLLFSPSIIVKQHHQKNNTNC